MNTQVANHWLDFSHEIRHRGWSEAVAEKSTFPRTTPPSSITFLFASTLCSVHCCFPPSLLTLPHDLYDALLFSSVQLQVSLSLLRSVENTLAVRSFQWAQVVVGMWHKYPNPHCSHVVTVDVLDRTVDPKTGIIRTERILGCKQKAPTWIVTVSDRRTRVL